MSKKILIVDDEPQLLEMLKARAERENYEVLTAADGQAGLELAQTQRPDVIILDLMLPKMDGYRVCGLLKKDARFRHILIVLFTAKAEDQDKGMAKEAGADLYVTKLTGTKDLMVEVERLLKRRQ